MTEAIGLDGLDVVDVEVELGGLRRDVLGDLLELGPAAADDGARAGALGRAVVLAQAALVVFVVAAEVERRDVLQADVFHAAGAGAARVPRAQLVLFLAQPVAEPRHVAVAVQRIAQDVSKVEKVQVVLLECPFQIGYSCCRISFWCVDRRCIDL